MRIVSLGLREWRSFEECDLEFPDGLIGVRGLNGAGKSTLAEAIGWALFGKLRTRAKVGDLRRQGAAGRKSSVELTFQLGATLYRIERIVGGEARLWIDDSLESTKTRDTNTRVARELDLGWDAFERTVFCQQKDLAALDPGATGPQRKAHVERLLGLDRYRRAAEAARSAATRIRNELNGLREIAPDLVVLRAELEVARNEASAGDPSVVAAEARLAGAVVQRDRARKAEEAGRELEHARHRYSSDHENAARLEARIVERGARQSRLDEIGPSIAELPAIRARLVQYDGLAGAECSRADEETALRKIAFDPEVTAEVLSRLERLTAERIELQSARAATSAELDRARERASALKEAESAGGLATHESALEVAEREGDALRSERAVLEAQLDQDRAHVGEVETGGPETPCPVCRKPFGPEHDSILAAYRRRIEQAESRLPELIAELEKNKAFLDDLKTSLQRATWAAQRVSESTGAPTLIEAEAALDELTARLAEQDGRIAAIDEELPAAEATARDLAERGVRFSEREPRLRQAEEQAAALRAELDVDGYDPEAHESIRGRLAELEQLETEVNQLRGSLEASTALDVELERAHEALETSERAVRRHEVALEALGVSTVDVSELRTAAQQAEAAWEEDVAASHQARSGAQARSERVTELGLRVSEAEATYEVVKARELAHLHHDTAAKLLSGFRDLQVQVASPRLEVAASALLSSATDGRYSDVRLSDDYRLLVLDRGEEHELARYSGGEQDLANLCLRLAIADWVARERGAELGFVVLDEVFGSLDDERRQRLLGELRGLSNRFRQVLVITHLPEIADLCDSQLEVVLEEPGRSTARFVS